MNTLQRHLAYLEAQGITPLMLRAPVAGALLTPQWFDQSSSMIDELIKSSSTDVAQSTQPLQDQAQKIPLDAKNLLDSVAQSVAVEVLEKTPPQTQSVEKVLISFNLSILPVGPLLLIDDMQAKGNRRLHQQLLANLAQALLSAPVHNNFIELNWPLNDHRALDHSETSALSFIQVWLESLTTRQQTRLIVLFGDVAKQWFLDALSALQLPYVVVPSSWTMLENSDQKAECWRLIRAYQSLVSAPSASKTPSN